MKLKINRNLLRRLVWPLSIIVPILLSVGTSIFALLQSTHTLPWIIELAQTHAPGTLHIAAASGNLAGPLIVEGLTYHNADITLKIGKLYLDWNLIALLHLQLAIRDLSMEQVQVILPQTTGRASSDISLPNIILPIGISIEQGTITDLQITQPDNSVVSIPHIALNNIYAGGSELSIGQLSIAALGGQVQVAGILELTPYVPMNLQVQWIYQPPTGPAIAGNGTVIGSLEQLQLEQTLASPLNSQFSITLQKLNKLPHLDAQLTVTTLDLAPLTPAVSIQLTGKIHAVGKPDDLQLIGHVQTEHPAFGTLTTNIDAVYAKQILTAKQLTFTHPSGGQIILTGHYKPDLHLGKFATELSWRDLRWPLTGDTVQARSSSGTLKLSGKPAAYTYQLATALTIPDTPPVDIKAKGTGNLNGLILADLTVQAQKMRITGNGGANWAPKQTWNIKLQGKNLNPALLNADFPGRITATVATSGQFVDGRLDLGAITTKIQGVLRGYPLASEAKFTLQGTEIAISQLNITSGPNHLRANGRIGVGGIYPTPPAPLPLTGEGGGKDLPPVKGGLRGVGEEGHLAINWNLNAPNLAAILPQLAGKINAQGKLSGSLVAPLVKAQISGKNLTYTNDTSVVSPLSRQGEGGRGGGVNSLKPTARLDSLITDVDLNLTKPGHVALKLQAKQLATADYQWQNLELSITGIPTDHKLSLVIAGSEVPTGKLQLNAGLTPEFLWQGSLNQLELTLPKLTTWQLQQATDFTLGATQQHLNTLCLHATLGTVCGSIAATATQGWNAKINASNITLKLLQPWLPPPMTLDGYAEFNTQLGANAAGQLQGNVNLILPQGILKITDAESAPVQHIDFSNTQVQAQLQPQATKVSMQAPLAGLGSIQAELNLTRFDPMHLDPLRQSITGRIQAKLPNLGFIEGISPQLANVQGSFHLNYNIGGQLAAPKLYGRTNLTNGSLDIPALGLAFKDIVLQAQGQQNDRKLIYHGSMRSGTGVLKLTGDTRLDATPGPLTNIALDGTDVLAVNLPEAEIKISPHVRISNVGGRTDIQGEIQIPYGYLRPRTLPATAVVNSKDLVLTGREIVAKPASLPMDLHAKVKLILGQHINFAGFGMRANPSGELLIIYKPGRPPLGRGRIGVNKGTYIAYGQDLDIQRGYVLFADAPLDNPGLDVRAVRVVDSVTAGIKVVGTLKQPKLTLFSTPSLAQGDILSYIMRGKPINTQNSGDMFNRTQVVSALLSSQTGDITDEIARKLRLDELKLDTKGDVNQTSVTAGTYLAPSLYIQYVNTPGTRESSVRMRYDLTEDLQIQTESGKNQGVDLFYTIER